MEKDRDRIGIVNFPGGTNFTPLSNLITVISGLSDHVSIILGRAESCVQKTKYPTVEYCPVDMPVRSGLIARLVTYGIIQLKISYHIFRIGKRVDSWIFFIGGDTLVVPVIAARLLGKRVIILVAGSSIAALKSKNDPLYHGLRLLRFITCTLADKIIVYADCLVREYSLGRWRSKISIAHEHVVDFDMFAMNKPYPSRDLIVGYVGRFGEEKGILNFIAALSGLLTQCENLTVMIGGDGPLKAGIERSLLKEHLAGRVTLMGWISHDDLPHYLNQMRLLVLPSYTEGLPNVMIESMACGTPVLATPVGVIPDIIEDGRTGFIMEDNSPECIVKNVLRVLNSPMLERVALGGKRVIEENFTVERTLRGWKKVLFR